MAQRSNPPRKIFAAIVCTHCGNRTGVDPETGDRVALLIRVDRLDLTELVEDIAEMRCVDCSGPMDVKVLEKN